METTLTTMPIKGQEALKRVGVKLKRLRKTHNYTQKEIAEKLNLGLRSYQRIENRETIYDLILLYKACSIYGVDFSSLASPYAPKECFKNSFYNSADDIPFDGAQQVMETLHTLKADPENFNAGQESKSFGRSLAVASPFKIEYSGLSREDMAAFNEAFMIHDPVGAEQLWDEVIYHQPKYSAFRLKNGKVVLSRHFYSESTEYTLSTIL